MKLTNMEIEKIAKNISNFTYQDNLKAVRELTELFNRIAIHPLKTWEDYVKMYDDNFYTYRTFKDLVESEKEQSDGLTEEECFSELNDPKYSSIWQLPCGWYVQYV